MPASISVRNFPISEAPPDTEKDGDKKALGLHLTRIAKAVNQLGMQAFPPVTTETSTSTVYAATALNTDVTMTALTQTIQVPVRSKLAILAQAELNSHTYVAGMAAQLRIYVDSTALSAAGITWGATMALPATCFGLFVPAERDTTYTVSVAIRLTGTGGGAPEVRNIGSALVNRLMVRVEPYPLTRDT